MKKKRWLILLAATGLVLVLAGLWGRSPPPSYAGKPVADWAALVAAPDPAARAEAAAAIRALGTNAVPTLVRLLEFNDAYWRRKTWLVAPRLPPRLRQFALQLTGAPQAANRHVAAARSAALLGPLAQPAIPALVGVVYGADAQARYDAALALGQIGPPALPAIAAALDHRDRNVRYVALCALASARPPDVAIAIPAMLRAMIDTDEGVRVAARNTFAQLGTNTLPFLTRAIAQGDPPARQSAALALPNIHGPRALTAPPLLALAQDKDPASRLKAIQALSQLGLPDRTMVQTFATALKDPDPEVRLAALYGLIQGRWFVSAATVPVLFECLEDASPKVREWAARLLGFLASRTPALAPAAEFKTALTRRLEDPEENVRAAARDALDKLKPL